jgi:hypothetical protein
LGWVFFRASTLEASVRILRGIAAFQGGIELQLLVLPLGITALLLFIDLPQERRNDHVAMLRWHWSWRGLSYAGLLIACALLRVTEDVPFIYFQF